MIKLVCGYCGKSFYRKKAEHVNHIINHDREQIKDPYITYCSKKCVYNSRTLRVMCKCGTCGVSVERTQKEILKSKSGKSFCSRSCSAIYNNKHKNIGTRRSKLEILIEDHIRNKYPTLSLLCNDLTTIYKELDIYFPTLRLAIEINGIFHYKPIYGEEKLARIQSNDLDKIEACMDANIELLIIPSLDSNMNKRVAKKYINKIDDILRDRLSKLPENPSVMSLIIQKSK